MTLLQFVEELCVTSEDSINRLLVSAGIDYRMSGWDESLSNLVVDSTFMLDTARVQFRRIYSNTLYSI